MGTVVSITKTKEKAEGQDFYPRRWNVLATFVVCAMAESVVFALGFILWHMLVK